MFGRILRGCRAAASAANSARLTETGGRTPTGPFLGWGARVPSGGVERQTIRRRCQKTLLTLFIYGVVPTLLPHCCQVSCRSPARPGLHPRSVSSLLPVPGRREPPSTVAVGSSSRSPGRRGPLPGNERPRRRSPDRRGLHPGTLSAPLTGPPTPPAPPGAFRCPAFVPARVARPRAPSPRHRGPRGHARYSR